MLISLSSDNTGETYYKEFATVGAQLLRTDKVGLTMTSKLARQMALKKRLEEEHREFQERCKVRQNMF